MVQLHVCVRAVKALQKAVALFHNDGQSALSASVVFSEFAVISGPEGREVLLQPSAGK